MLTLIMTFTKDVEKIMKFYKVRWVVNIKNLLTE